MNAVIVDIKKKQAAALDESGRVVRIHNTGYELGQTIELHVVRPVRTTSAFKRIGSGVAAAVLVAMIGAGTAYAMPCGTVTLDGDSSVAYTINCFDYVLDVRGVNEEGEALLADMDASELRHHRIDAAVEATLEHMERPYSMGPTQQGLRISADTGNERHSGRLLRELEPVVEGNRPASSDADPASNAEDTFRGKSQPQPGQEQTPPQEEMPAQEEIPIQSDRLTDGLTPGPETPGGEEERREAQTDTETFLPAQDPDFPAERPAEDGERRAHPGYAGAPDAAGIPGQGMPPEMGPGPVQ